MIISIQGFTAVGKTTSLNIVREKKPNWEVVDEQITKINQKLGFMGLVPENLELFIERQRTFFNEEVRFLKKLEYTKTRLFDNSIESIEFFTFNFSPFKRNTHEIKKRLSREINELRRYSSDYIIYLYDTFENLKEKKMKDTSKKERHILSHAFKQVYEEHYRWFIRRGAITLNVVNISPEEVADGIIKIIETKVITTGNV